MPHYWLFCMDSSHSPIWQVRQAFFTTQKFGGFGIATTPNCHDYQCRHRGRGGIIQIGASCFSFSCRDWPVLLKAHERWKHNCCLKICYWNMVCSYLVPIKPQFIKPSQLGRRPGSSLNNHTCSFCVILCWDSRCSSACPAKDTIYPDMGVSINEFIEKVPLKWML